MKKFVLASLTAAVFITSAGCGNKVKGGTDKPSEKEKTSVTSDEETTEAGSDEELAKSLRRLSAIEENLEVYPGHGEFTSLDEERRYNVYMASAHSEWQDV